MRKIFILTLLFFVPLANATIINNGTYTTINGLDWLDWSLTRGMTQQEALTKYDKLGYGNAFRTATHEEAIDMLDTLYIDTFDNGPIPWNGETAILTSFHNYDFLFKVHDLLGRTTGPGQSIDRSYAFIDGLGVYGVREGNDIDSVIFGGDDGIITDLAGGPYFYFGDMSVSNYSFVNAGVVLVRVPAPSAPLLLLIMLIGLINFKKMSKQFQTLSTDSTIRCKYF
ncbi:hypothetical protein MT390_13660 [Vibrio sp. 2-Bac 85]